MQEYTYSTGIRNEDVPVGLVFFCFFLLWGGCCRGGYRLGHAIKYIYIFVILVFDSYCLSFLFFICILSISSVFFFVSFFGVSDHFYSVDIAGRRVWFGRSDNPRLLIAGGEARFSSHKACDSTRLKAPNIV